MAGVFGGEMFVFDDVSVHGVDNEPSDEKRLSVPR